MRQLYYYTLSPACRKARLMLAEKGLIYHLQQEIPWQPSARLYALNPLGEAPVLVEENDEVIAGNYALTEYLEEKHPSPNLLGKTLADRTEIRRLLDWFDNRFAQEVAQPLLMEKVYKRFGKGGAPDTAMLRQAKTTIDYHMDYIVYLTETQPWLAGDNLSLADLTAGAYLSVVDYLGDVPWQKFPEAKQWYSVIKSRPGFRVILTERVAGIMPPPYYDNPDF